MARFYVGSNNGVTTVVPAFVYESNKRRWEQHRELEVETPFTLERPIFTFSNTKALQPFVTGTMADMRALLEGHETVQGGTYVPFSNGIQWGNPEDPSVKQELSYRTTLREVMNAFGLVPHPEVAQTTPGWFPVKDGIRVPIDGPAPQPRSQIAWRRVS